MGRGRIIMFIDEWKYFDDNKQTIVVNIFSDDGSDIQVNVFVANNKDITKNVSVHDVMVEIPNLEDIII